MTADTLKTTRVLELYQAFLSGKLINKQEAAEQYHVNARSIQRDIDSIRDFLAEQCAKEAIVRKIEYDKKENGYRYYLEEEFKIEYPEKVAAIRSEEYYVNMVRAWYFATALAKKYDQVLPFLEEQKMDVWTHNKTIQKAIESYRITLEQKEYLRTLKIK